MLAFDDAGPECEPGELRDARFVIEVLADAFLSHIAQSRPETRLANGANERHAQILQSLSDEAVLVSRGPGEACAAA